jgi:hypothetical protein
MYLSVNDVVIEQERDRVYKKVQALIEEHKKLVWWKRWMNNKWLRKQIFYEGDVCGKWQAQRIKQQEAKEMENTSGYILPHTKGS